MTNLNLVCLQFEEYDLLTSLETSLTNILSSTIVIREESMQIDQFFQSDRGQYDASSIITSYDGPDIKGRIILLTSVDLFIPIFTFVFGLAKLNGNIGIVSTHRLKSEFYGLPSDDDLLQARLIKEIVHELGHLLNLRHCSNYYCVMTSSNTADDIDIKSERFCKSCLKKAAQLTHT